MNGMIPLSLVLLPGMDGTGKLFDPFVQDLPDWIKPIIVSYPLQQPLDYSGLLEHVKAAVPTEGPFVLLGECFSGPLALMAAAEHPAGLQGVILCSTFVAWPLSLPAAVAQLFVRLGLFHLKSSAMIRRLLLGSHADGELKDLFAAALGSVQPDVLAARARAVMTVDCSRELRLCPVPVLVLEAARDRIVSSSCAERIRTIRPDATFVRIDSPHLILQCATSKAVDEISRFVRTCMV